MNQRSISEWLVGKEEYNMGENKVMTGKYCKEGECVSCDGHGNIGFKCRREEIVTRELTKLHQVFK